MVKETHGEKQHNANLHHLQEHTKEATGIATALLQKKLIACTNMFSMESMYKWKGKLQNSKEVVLIAKTKPQNYLKIQKVVKKLHSYNVPCIMKIDAIANKPYYKWLMGEMK